MSPYCCLQHLKMPVDADVDQDAPAVCIHHIVVRAELGEKK